MAIWIGTLVLLAVTGTDSSMHGLMGLTDSQVAYNDSYASCVDSYVSCIDSCDSGIDSWVTD